MTHTTPYPLIDLAAFREDNRLLQQDLADFLNVSRGYISLVEKGRSKLSRANVMKIKESAEAKHWDTARLIPAATRLDAALDYHNITLNEKRQELGLGISMISVPQDLYDAIARGESPIPDYIVHLWEDVYPELNYDWLMTGEGEMLKPLDETKVPEIVQLREEVTALRATVDSLRDDLKSIVEAATERIIAEMRKESV